MTTASDRLVNLFGAMALGVADLVRHASLDEQDPGGEATAGLVVIGHDPGMSIDQLRRVLRLSHPGAVRVVDRLSAAGLAVRTPAEHDRRAVTLNLTQRGQEYRGEILDRRNATLKAALGAVAAEDLAILERIADSVLAHLPDDAYSALTICRFCDESCCAACPMDRFGAVVRPSSAPT